MSCLVSFQEPGVFTDVRKHLDWIKSTIEGSEDSGGGYRQLSGHDESANERIYNRILEPANASDRGHKGHGHTQKPHHQFDPVGSI